jgi:hypothetical protein
MLPDGLEFDGPLDEDHPSDPAKRARRKGASESPAPAARGNVQA